MTDQIRWGILSTANIGRKAVIPAIQASRNGVVAAVASRSAEKAETFARDLNIPQAYPTYEALIAAPDIDAIYNPLPNADHAAWSLRCAEAGKPALCEKPLARDGDEAQSMVDAFASREVLFAEAFMYRFHPQTQRVRELLQDGRVGDPLVLNATFTFQIRRENDIRLDLSLAGGALMDVGCYCVNVMRLLAGEEPTAMRAAAQVGERSGVDEVLTGLLTFPSGVEGHFDCSLRAHRTHTYEIRGTQGRILVESGFVMPADTETTIRVWHGDAYEAMRIPPANSYQLMVEDFADALLQSRPPRFAPQDAVDNMRVLDALRAAAGMVPF
ncbi:MAG: Gfo/Idh/MocA family oxidoreductase [Chloroflexi bacterium]|nr:Gfo/Idh/MocA family oxidoreductase [Chloroflexota bacterium]